MTQLRIPVSENDHRYGDASAPAVLVEYGDYQCPYCGKAYPIVKKLQEEFGDRLSFVFRNFPLEKIHPYAVLAALAAEAAARQNAFWQMHDMIFENQSEISPEGIMTFVERLNLDPDQFASDLTDNVLKEKVDSDFMSGMRSGVNGTPSFFINGEKFEGPAVYITLQHALQKIIG